MPPIQSDVTMQKCEDAIEGLIDYFEENLKILSDNLSETLLNLVVVKIWQEILFALEDVMLAPLSDQPSDMRQLDEYEMRIVLWWLEVSCLEHNMIMPKYIYIYL